MDLQTNINQCEDVQNATTVTLECKVLEFRPVEVENSRFCDVIVLAF